MFLYELNVVNSKVNGRQEIVFNYNKNTINKMNSQPFVNFDFSFSPISIEYKEGNENFLEFLTYILGLTGGLISVLRLINSCIFNMFYSKRYQQIPDSNWSLY